MSIGSGQVTADPFLAFIRRLFWPNSLPTVADGIFASMWTVRHAIQTSPGGVADPIQVVVLQQSGARELEEAELVETEQAIRSAERRCAQVVPTAEAMPAPDLPPPPEPPTTTITADG